jgi:hypothetical protein
VIKQASGLDVVAAMPGRFGFTPADSIVTAGLHPPRGRMGATIRVDRADCDSAGWRDFARAQAIRLHGCGARASFVIRYAPEGAEAVEKDRGFWRWSDAVDQCLPVIGCWNVVQDSYQELDPTTHRRVGPVLGPKELQSTRGAAATVMAGVAPKASREDLARIDPAPPAARKAAGAAWRRVLDQTLAMSADRLPAWRLAGLETWSLWLDRLVRSPDRPVEPSQLGRIAALIGDSHIRDAIMASAFKRRGDTPRLLALGRYNGAIFDPASSPGVDQDRVAAALSLLEDVAAHLPPRRRGQVYGLGAAWHWWSGNGAAAQEWAKAAEDCEDCPRLAGLILAVAGQGIFPAALERREA